MKVKVTNVEQWYTNMQIMNKCTCATHNLQNNMQALNSYDPTRTLTLRNQFAAEMGKRFRALRGLIRRAIIDKDVFGFQNEDILPSQFAADDGMLPPRKAFNFRRSSDKVEAFMDWLNNQADAVILQGKQIGSAIEERWTDVYIQSAYQKGITRGRQELRNAGYTGRNGEPVPLLETENELRSAFNQPFHADRVGLLYTRTYNDLKGVTNAMDTQISRVLSQGMADGLHPRQMARMLNRTIAGPSGDLGITDTLGRYIPPERRAKMIARTETIRAHHQATIQEYKNWGVEGVKVRAEWQTAGFGVCPLCLDMAAGGDFGNGVYKLDTIEGLIPYHPNCRCMALPVDVTDLPEEQTQPSPTATGGGSFGRTQKAKSPPMNAVGRFDKCIIPNVKSFQLQVFAIPQACRDYVRGDDGNWYLNNELITDEQTLGNLKKMRIPPAWRNVVVAKDKNLKIQAIGLDKAGRWQYRYSAEHIAEAARRKFDRVKSFSQDVPGILRKVDEGVSMDDPRAYLLRLESKTAIRAGSAADFKAKKKAYGLTTLQHEHVEVVGNKIKLSFIAKKGKPAYYELEDDVLASWLAERKAATQVGEKLFPDIPASKLNDYIKELADGKKYTIKDFRTYHATRMAYDELKQYAGKELTENTRKKIVKEVSEKVSEFLHNTPAMAKSSYIDPMVWDYIGGLPT